MGVSTGVAVAVSTPNLEVGALLMKWNGADISQWDADIKDYERDLGSPSGGNAGTAVVVTVVPHDLPDLIGGNVLRFTGTSLAGGGIFTVKESVLTLPSRFVVVIQYAGNPTGSFSSVGVMIFDDDVVDDMQGFYIDRPFGGSQHLVRPIIDNIKPAVSELLNNSGLFDAATEARGGVRNLITFEKRPAGETPALAMVSCVDRRSIAGVNVAFDTALPHTITGVSTNWDGLDFNRIGICVDEGINNSTFSIDIAAFAIYAHPDD